MNGWGYRILSYIIGLLLGGTGAGSVMGEAICGFYPELRPQPEYIESVFAGWDGQVTASVGEVSLPVFMVEFQDAKYKDTKVSMEELNEWIYTGEDSIAAYYNISSHGRMKITGDLYSYTAEKNIGEYETGEALEGLIMELLAFYDNDVDFSQYDKNNDGIMDCLMICVPGGGDGGFWWGAQHTWYYNWEYEIDGVNLMNYVVNDEQPYSSSRDYFLGTMEHELGHCLGLPDYYKYNYTGWDYEGMHGLAGKERMDDSEGDFSQFSKLQLGWLTEEQVQIMPGDVQSATFYLPPVKEGGCLLIFPRDREPDFQSEYFLAEYNTPEGLQAGLFAQGGVRVLHVQAEIMENESGYHSYKYGNYSPYYDESNNGIRILKLVNDGNGFFREGDTVEYEKTGGAQGNFGWYTEDGSITDPGFRIRIGELQENGYMEVEVVWDQE